MTSVGCLRSSCVSCLPNRVSCECDHVQLVAGAGSGRVSSFVFVFEVVVVISRWNSVCVSKDGDSRSCTYWMDRSVLAVELEEGVTVVLRLMYCS